MISALIQILIGGLLAGGLYAIGAFGLSISFGVLRVLNLAHGDFLMLGGFAGYALHKLLGLNPFLSILLVAPVFLGIGMLVQRWIIARITDRTMHELLVGATLITLGLSMILEDVTAFAWGGSIAGIPYSLPSLVFGGVSVPLIRLLVLLATIVLTVAIHLFLTRTFLGRAIVALTQEREGALAVGVNIPVASMATFGLGIALAAAAGILYALLFTVEPFMGLPITVKFLAIIVLGGMGSLPGGLLGGLIIGLGEALTGFYIGPHWTPTVAFVFLLATLLVRPHGLFGRA